MDICTNACERNVANNEKVRNIENNRRTRPAPHVTHQCAQAIKEVLDQRYGPSWHVVVGEGFGFDISYEVESHGTETLLFAQLLKCPGEFDFICILFFRSQDFSTCSLLAASLFVCGDVLRIALIVLMKYNCCPFRQLVI